MDSLLIIYDPFSCVSAGVCFSSLPLCEIASGLRGETFEDPGVFMVEILNSFELRQHPPPPAPYTCGVLLKVSSWNADPGGRRGLRGRGGGGGGR
jgi:hypothetical protein